VATFCRLPRISGVLCKRALQNNGSFLEGTYLFGQPAKTLAFGISMRWLRLVGSLKTWSLLQKSPIKELYSAEETYIFKEPTNHSHAIETCGVHR